jgi:hypothetical protein
MVETSGGITQKTLILILVLFILLVIILLDDPITIVGNIGPMKYTNHGLDIQYIGYPFVPFANISP